MAMAEADFWRKRQCDKMCVPQAFLPDHIRNQGLKEVQAGLGICLWQTEGSISPATPTPLPATWLRDSGGFIWVQSLLVPY